MGVKLLAEVKIRRCWSKWRLLHPINYNLACSSSVAFLFSAKRDNLHGRPSRRQWNAKPETLRAESQKCSLTNSIEFVISLENARKRCSRWIESRQITAESHFSEELGWLLVDKDFYRSLSVLCSQSNVTSISLSTKLPPANQMTWLESFSNQRNLWQNLLEPTTALSAAVMH